MAYARVSYTGDGSTKIFTVPFPYLSASYVEVRVAGVLKAVTTDYTWVTSSTIQFVTAPANGATVFLLRNTPKESRLVNYQDAAILREVDLDLDSDQAFHVVQEGLDAIVNSRTVKTFVAGVDYTAGVTTTLALGDATVEATTITVLFDAAAQQHTTYSLSAGIITFTAPIPVGVLQVEVAYAIPLATGLIDGSVTNPKLASNVLSADVAGRGKMADGFLTQPKMGANVSGNGPIFAANNIAPQALTTGVATKITLDNEGFDSNNNFAASRFTPTIPGYYQLNWMVNITANPLTRAYTAIYRNGVDTTRGSEINLASAAAITTYGSTGSAFAYLNGTTDYLELYVLAVGTTLTASFSNLSGCLVRAA